MKKEKVYISPNFRSRNLRFWPKKVSPPLPGLFQLFGVLSKQILFKNLKVMKVLLYFGKDVNIGNFNCICNIIKMSFTCYLCNSTFTQKHRLITHLSSRCKSVLLTDPLQLNNLLEQQDKQIKDLNKQIITIHGNQNTVNSNNTINLNILIQPITKLSIEHISTDKMKSVIESYDKTNNSKLNSLLSEYLNGVLCDSSHPENHAVKYTKKYPPTFNAITEDAEGNIVSIIKGLKDTCELLSDPVLAVLKTKMTEFLKKYKADTEPDFDYGLYEDAIDDLRKELKKDNIKKVLSSFLKNDLLNNIEMKLSVTN